MPTILIVDDHPSNRKFLATLLGRQHYRVLEASDGGDALDIVRTARPDLVISDILMPTMDGYEFVRQLRADPAIAAVPVIFFTAHYDRREARELARSCGVARILMKPCDPQLTLATVAQALAAPPGSGGARPPRDFDQSHLRVVTDELADTADELRVSNLRLAEHVARLRAREAGLSRAQSMANLAHVITGNDGAFESWSDTLPGLIGVDPARMPLSARDWLALLDPDHRAAVRAKSVEAGVTGKRVDIEYSLRRESDGAWVHIRQVTEPLEGSAGAGGQPLWFSTLQDMTPQKQAEAVLRSRTAHLQRMSRQLITVEEQERSRLGRELHDRVGANLGALLLSFEVLRSKFPPAVAQQFGPRISDCEALLRETIGHVRSVLGDLRPPALDELGLLAALDHYVLLLARRGAIKITADGREPAPRLPAEAEISLFRIAQEALNNATRHAHATSIAVALNSDAVEVTLDVIDDGRGFDARLARTGSGSLGLVTMRERADAMNGQLTIVTAPGQGTHLRVSVPRHLGGVAPGSGAEGPPAEALAT